MHSSFWKKYKVFFYYHGLHFYILKLALYSRTQLSEWIRGCVTDVHLSRKLYSLARKPLLYQLRSSVQCSSVCGLQETVVLSAYTDDVKSSLRNTKTFSGGHFLKWTTLDTSPSPTPAHTGGRSGADGQRLLYSEGPAWNTTACRLLHRAESMGHNRHLFLLSQNETDISRTILF